MSDFKAAPNRLPAVAGGAYKSPSWILGVYFWGKGGEGKGGHPLLFRYTPSHYILDKSLYAISVKCAFPRSLCRFTYKYYR